MQIETPTEMEYIRGATHLHLLWQLNELNGKYFVDSLNKNPKTTTN